MAFLQYKAMFKKRLLDRGYKKTFIETIFNQFHFKHRNRLLENYQRKSKHLDIPTWDHNKIIPLKLKYSKRKVNGPLREILQKYAEKLSYLGELKLLFTKGKNLQNLFTRSRLSEIQIKYINDNFPDLKFKKLQAEYPTMTRQESLLSQEIRKELKSNRRNPDQPYLTPT
jgi:hypothetical protein